MAHRTCQLYVTQGLATGKLAGASASPEIVEAARQAGMNLESVTHLWTDWNRPMLDIIMDKSLSDWITTAPPDVNASPPNVNTSPSHLKTAPSDVNAKPKADA